MITVKTPLEAWRKSLNFVFNNGNDFTDSNNRLCREILNLVLVVEKPEINAEAPIDALKKLHNWSYPNFSEIKEIILSKKPALEYLYSYGHRLFDYREAVNQIDNYVIPLLKSSSTSRRAVANLWEPEHDAIVGNKEVPGLVSIDFKLRNNKLNMTAVLRSSDLFFGWPANIYQLFVLQEYVSKKLDCQIGTLTTFLNSAHIFGYQFEFIKKLLKE